MKADLSRDTYRRDKHYSSVRQQQGRVQLDADWNEQADIEAHLRRSLGADVIGLTGVPIEQNKANVNFEITAAADSFTIAAGRFYVDGILCENEATVDASAQPDMPRTGNNRFVVVRENNVEKFTALPLPADGQYLAYLDVWQRHFTGLEDPDILEPALGGPDTATRAKTVWQAKLLKLPKASNCKEVVDIQDWHDLLRDKTAIAPPATMAAQAAAQQGNNNPCIVPPRAGYRRLENQLYRVEIHRVTAQGASFKWSRDNGSLVTQWTGQDPTKKKILKVKSIGRDKTLRFASGQWIELTDRRRELLGEPGTLVQVVTAADDEIEINETTATGSIDFNTDFDKADAKIRRWDMDPAADVKNNHGIPAALSNLLNEVWIPLEDGIQVKFMAGTFRVGDYWLIPARTDIGDIQWPPDDNNKPKQSKPHGVHHHYASLALLHTAANGSFERLSDCRPKFPPVTELTSFYYLSGDGQEVMPDIITPGNLVALAAKLKVGVSNGQWPVTGAKVQFTILPDNNPPPGTLQPAVATTNAGVAECSWSLSSNPAFPVQQVKAQLLDAAGQPTTLQPPIIFTAQLSMASRVAYPPKCTFQSGDINVEKALDTLASLPRLHKMGGDGQDGQLDAPLELPIEVLITSDCGPLKGVEVTFEASKNGKLGKEKADVPGGAERLVVKTDKQGIAACFWMLNPKGAPSQELNATLTEQLAKVGAPVSVSFTGNLLRDAREPGIFVAKVTTRAADLENDQTVTLDDLVEGIIVACKANPQTSFNIFPTTVNRATCFVMVERPDDKFVDPPTLSGGFAPLILRANPSAKGDTIRWIPDKRALDLMKKSFEVWISQSGDKRFLAHFTLKGNFICTESDPVMYLDGEVFGSRDNTLDAKRRGDGRRGGDFEMWFWIAPGAVRPPVVIDRGVINIRAIAGRPGIAVPARVPLAGEAVLTNSAGVPVRIMKVTSDIPGVTAELAGQPDIAAGGNFTLKLSAPAGTPARGGTVTIETDNPDQPVIEVKVSVGP